MKKSRYILAFASLLIAALPNSLYAEEPTELIAYNASQKDSVNAVDDDILAAMQALDEVGAMLDQGNKTDSVNVDDIIQAASNDADKMAQKAATPQTTSFRIDDVVDSPKIATTTQSKETPVAKVEPKTDAPKHDLQTAPVTPAKETTVAKVEPKTDAPKHDLQTAPVNPAKETTVSKAEPKSDAPKHDLQTAPVNPSKETTVAKVASKPETTVAKAEPKTDAPKHDLQTAPVNPSKDTTVAKATSKPETTVAKAEQVQKHIAPNGVHTTTASQAGLAQPELSPASAPQSLPMAYAMAIYQVNGVDLTQASPKKTMPTIAELYQYAFDKKLVYQSTTPAIGDLVFFHNTFDRNRDGRWNDWHTLIGVVEGIDSNQTISILLYRTDRIERISMNLKYPELEKNKKGQILNSQLRSNEGAQRGISSKLFAGFANLLGDATSVTVIDNWKPGMKIK